MDKFIIKRPRNCIGSSSVPDLSQPSTPHLENQNDVIEFNPDEIVSDPGLRKPIESFDVNVRDRIRRGYVSKGPCQPFGHNFPKKKYGKDNRSFRDEWFNTFIWLEYSIANDAAYCFWCYLFKPSHLGVNTFTTLGVSDWKKAMEKFKTHVGGVNSPHNNARILFEGFINQRQSVTYLHTIHDREAEIAYRIRLTASLDVIRFLLRQGLPFRGHDESSTSSNRGNFLELLEWYGQRNSNIGQVTCNNAPQNNQMTSPQIQKQLVNACAIETTLAILGDIGDSLFSILLDDSRDCSVKEQMAVVLRYVNKEGEIVERFLAIVHVAETSAVCLKNAIDSLFAKHGLSLSRLRGQGYDGASNMRGEFNGLKSLILKENSYARYIHCFAHQLQLVVVAVAKGNRIVSDFFSLINMIVNMSGSSCKRMDKLRQLEHDRKIERLERGEIICGRGKNQESSLARPGDTRWGSHHLTLLRLEQLWPSVIELLEDVYNDGANSETRGIINTLLIRMESYDFVFVLLLMKHLLGLTNELSMALQEKDQNLVNAMNLVEVVKIQVQKFRDFGWDSFLKEVESFCNSNSITVINMEDAIKSRSRMKRDGQTVTNYHRFRVEIYCEVLDLIAQEMENRFPESSTELLICISCLDPRDSFSRFDVDRLVRLADLYPDDFSYTDRMIIRQQLETYIEDVRRDNRFADLQNLGSLGKKMIDTMKNRVFPLVYRLIELALILPVATASVERVFSAMKFVKTHLRNRMGDEWLNDSLVVYIEKDVFAKIDNEAMLLRFQNMDTRRNQLSRLP